MAGGPPILVVDPWRWAEDGLLADLVLLTSGRMDACSPDDIATARRGDAPILCPLGVAPRLARDFGTCVVGLAPGASWSGPGVTVRALGAAAVPRARCFLRDGEALTWFVTTASVRVLFLGASDALPGHEGLSPDVATFAVGDFSFPTPDEAADAAARVRPRLAVPTHWGDLSGRFEAARRFAVLCEERGIAAVAVPGGAAED